MSKVLTDLGVRSVYFDIVFSEASAEEDDRLFGEAIGLSKNVYLPFVLQDPPYNAEGPLMGRLRSSLLPIEGLYSHIKGTGALNIYPDIDGTIRTIPLLFPGDKGPYLHAAFRLALDYEDSKIEGLAPRHIALSNPKGKFKIPLVQGDRLLINWLGRWQHTFKHYTFLEVLAGSANPDDFKDAICLVGVTAVGLSDIKSIPIESEYPGVGVVATAISNILDRRFLHTPPIWMNVLILYLLALMPTFLIRGEKPLRETAFVFGIGAVYFVVNLILFRGGIRADLSTPLAGLFGSYMGIGTYNFVRVAVERQSFFKMAVTDGLTGLFNIRYFKMLVDTEIVLVKSDPAKRFVIIMTDIDHFKRFNDTYGHQVGDLVLKESAGVLKASLRSSDVVARYGGEEMIMILRGTSLEDGVRIAEKIRKNVEEHAVKDKNNTYKVTISLGVSTFRPGDDVESIIKRADEGLYKAKESGRNRSFCVEPGSQSHL